MKNSKIEPISPMPSKSEQLLISFLKSKQKVITAIAVIFSIGLLGFITYSWSSSRKTKSMSVGSANISLDSSTSSVKQLKKIANNYPSLQPQLDGPLAQEFLNRGHVKASELFCKRIQKRQEGHLAFVPQFNEITYLIEEGQYKDARDKSYVLKDQLLMNPALKTLYATHLLRIIALEERLGNKEARTLLLKELEDINNQPTEAIQGALSLGKLNISDFLNKKEPLD